MAAATCVSTATVKAAWVWYAMSGHFGRIVQQSVSMVSATDGWIVGSSGTILRCHEGGWTGGWSPFGATTGPSLNSVYALNVNDAWALVFGGTTLHWDGTSWTIQTGIPSSVDLYSVFMVSTSDVWAVGYDNHNGRIFHYNGHAWGPWDCPGGCPNEALRSVYIAAGGVVGGWAVGSHGTILWFDGSTTWSPYTTTHPTDSFLLSVYMVNSGDGWAVGTGGTILHYDGTSWTAYPFPGSVLTYGGNPVTLYSVSMYVVQRAGLWGAMAPEE